MLNDKQHIVQQRARYQAYDTVVEEVDVQPGDAAAAYGLDDYDDEYDDTYDMNQVGANDLDGDSLLSRRWARGRGFTEVQLRWRSELLFVCRPFTVPQVLRTRTKPEEEEDEEEEEGGSQV